MIGEQCFLIDNDSSSDLIDMMFEAEVAVKNNSKIVDVWVERQIRVINSLKKDV